MFESKDVKAADDHVKNSLKRFKKDIESAIEASEERIINTLESNIERLRGDFEETFNNHEHRLDKLEDQVFF